MPETRGERIIFAIGALAIGALVALILLQTVTDRFETTNASARGPERALPTTTEAVASMPTTSLTTTDGAATDERATRAPLRPARLTLSAIADTWVEIRSGSADGDVLYSGILQQGTTEHFRSRHLWASFGAAANLTARLNGKPLNLPPGTYRALVDPLGLKPLPS